jgi:hypothetical protein
MVPTRGSAVIQNGGVTVNLIVPVDALTQYSKDEGGDGPPWDPKMLTGEDGVTVKDGLDAGSAAAVHLIRP